MPTLKHKTRERNKEMTMTPLPRVTEPHEEETGAGSAISQVLAHVFRSVIIALAIYGGLDLVQSARADSIYLPSVVNAAPMAMTLQQQIDALEARLACISTSSSTTDLYVDGCNLHIRNGANSTKSKNSLGNVIIGYNEGTVPPMVRDGSHNIVMGVANDYQSYGGVVVGENNIISGAHSSVLAGTLNVSDGEMATVLGGSRHQASGRLSAILGGESHAARGAWSTLAGGSGGVVHADSLFSSAVGGFKSQVMTNTKHALVAGGAYNATAGEMSTTFGGSHHLAIGRLSTIVGGGSHRAVGAWATVAGGGGNNVYSGTRFSTVVGGQANSIITDTEYAVITGGSHNLVSGKWGLAGGGGAHEVIGMHGTAIGGHMNRVEGNLSAVIGGLENRAVGQGASVFGGHINHAGGLASGVYGGQHNVAIGEYTTVSGGGENTADGLGASVSGGLRNKAGRGKRPGCPNDPDFVSTIGYEVWVGGQHNVASTHASVGVGGKDNRVEHEYSVWLGLIGSCSTGSTGPGLVEGF